MCLYLWELLCFILLSWCLKLALWNCVHAPRLKWKTFALSTVMLATSHLLQRVTLMTNYTHNAAYLNIWPCYVSALIIFVCQYCHVTLKMDCVDGIRTAVTTLTGWCTVGWTTPLGSVSWIRNKQINLCIQIWSVSIPDTHRHIPCLCLSVASLLKNIKLEMCHTGLVQNS